MTKTANSLTNQKVAKISVNLDVLSKFGIPCGYALSKNINKAKKVSDKYFNLLNLIRDKYCKLSNNNSIKYILLPKYAAMIKNEQLRRNEIAYEYYDAGDKQEEYEKKLTEAADAECKIQFLKIDMNRMVQSSSNKGKEITLAEKFDYEYDIPSNLLTALEGVIFVEGNGETP